MRILKIPAVRFVFDALGLGGDLGLGFFAAAVEVLVVVAVAFFLVAAEEEVALAGAKSARQPLKSLEAADDMVVLVLL